jgi:hypothetical protein
MPGRPPRRNESAQDDTHRAGGVIPAGAIAMLFAISGVFVYGIYLKAAGPSGSVMDAPARPASSAPAPGTKSVPAPSGTRPPASQKPPAPDAGLPTQTAMGYGDEPLSQDPGGSPSELPPVIPEATTAGALVAPGLAPGKPAPSSIAAPRPVPPPAPAPIQAPASSPAPKTPPRTSPAAPTVHDEPPSAPPRSAPTVAPKTSVTPPAASTAPAPGTKTVPRVAAEPRGTAPAVALRKAHEQFGAKRYQEAARSWNEWAQKAPAGSWTVQIAAIRLDKPTSAGKLEGIAGRDGAFVLPAGALPGGLAPVCVGVYPSLDAARRAAASMAPFPGSSSKPIPKALSSLSR